MLDGPIAATTFDNKTICEGDSVVLKSSGGSSYLWTPADGLSSDVIANPVAKPVSTTKYTIVVENEAQCKDSATVTIAVLSKPKANAGPDQEILEGQPVQLPATVTGGGATYNWSPAIFIDDVHALQPTVDPVSDITYALTANSVAAVECRLTVYKFMFSKRLLYRVRFHPITMV